MSSFLLFQTLCIERTILQTSYTLPGILRSFEVVSSRRVSLTPIECAIERMNEVNMELRSLVDKCRMKPNEYFNQLEMRLNGVISPSVNGGIPLFQEVSLLYQNIRCQNLWNVQYLACLYHFMLLKIPLMAYLSNHLFCIVSSLTF